MSGAARIVLLWVVCLTAVTSPCLSAISDSPTDARSLIDAGSYNEAESVAREQIDRFDESSRASLEKALTLDLWVEARWRNGKAWHPGTLEAAQWSESLKRQALGPESVEVADSLFHQARVLDEWARFEEARALYEEAIALYRRTGGTLYRRTGGTEDPRPAIAAAYLGGMLVELAQLNAARPYLEESVRSLEAAYGPDGPAVATALVPLAWLEKYSRNTDVAQSLFERALLIRESTLGPEHPDVAEPLDGLTRLLWETTSMQAGREMGRRAERIRLKAFGPDHLSLVYNYVLLWWTENPQSAGTYIERARSIAEASYPPNHPMLALALTYSAVAGDMNAGYSESWSQYERALQIFETSYGPNHWRVAAVLTNMAGLWHSLGEMRRFEEFHQRSRQIKAVSEVHRSRVWDLDGDTDRDLELGLIDLEEAIKRGEEAIELARKIHEPLFYQGFIFETQAERYRLAGRLEEAAEGYKRAIEVRAAHSGPEHMHLMDPLRDYANLRAEMGDFDMAVRLNRRALDILEAQLGPRHLQLQFSMDLEARLLWCMGDTHGAFEMARHLEKMQREIVEQAIVGLPERQSLAVLNGQIWGRDLMLSAAIAAPELARNRKVAEAAIRSRGLVLDSLARRHRRVGSANDPQVASLNHEVGAARERLARLVVGGGVGTGPEEHRHQVERARREKNRAELALAGRSGSFRQDREQASAGLAEVQTSLPRDSALIAYTRYQRFEPRTAGGAGASWPLDSTPSYLALVLYPGQARPELVELGPADEIDRQVRMLGQHTWSLAETADRSPRRSLASFRQVGAELRSLVWDPVASHVESSRRVFIVPDGELGMLPFGALPVGETGYLIESPRAIHYLSAERDLVGRGDDLDFIPGQGLLAMGHPAFDEPNLFAALSSEDNEVFQLAQQELGEGETVFRGHRASCGDFESLRFAALPASEGELESIRDSWLTSAASSGATLLSQARANEAAFKFESAGKSVVHLATHGFFLGGACESSAANQHQDWVENPLTLSGLALAGANHREAAGPDEEDGILTAEEIAALDLQGVQWAVLSGCETGVGEAMAGEGVFGLRRAFQIAGARTVIMSLWPVDDEATRQWMDALYRHRFAEKLSTLDAVHQASLDLLQARRVRGLSTHPFYWAGFVAAGDWR